MNRVRKLMGAEAAYLQGIYGEGVGVAVLDSGLALSHPDLKNRAVYTYNAFDETNNVTDDCGHGTHVCGIIGGNGVASAGKYQGLAPRCHFLIFKVLDQDGNGSSASVIRTLYWLMEHGKEYDVRIINISVGSRQPFARQEETSILVQAVEKAWDAGFVVCAAAGNEGPMPSSITSPGNSCKIITVGASDDNKMVSVRGIQKSNYSGRGPIFGCERKPDVVAPGSQLMSCNAKWNQKGQKPYIAKSGTSMATPVISGSLALLLSKEPALTNQEVKKWMYRSCKSLGLPGNQQGFGMPGVAGLLNGRG